MKKTLNNTSYITVIITVFLLVISCDNPQSTDIAQSEEKVLNFAVENEIAFNTVSPSVELRAPFTDTYTNVIQKIEGDTRKFTYTSKNPDIATVDDKGAVTLIQIGKATIVATQEAIPGKYKESTAQYTLIIERTKPKNKHQLAGEITLAIKAKGTSVNLDYIDTSNIIDMSYLFSDYDDKGFGLQKFNGSVPWDVSNVQNMSYMFHGATAFNDSQIMYWNTKSVTDMRSMFHNANTFNVDISHWDVKNVKSMYAMFSYARLFNRDITAWNIANVTDMRSMFQGATALTHNLEGWRSKLNAIVKKKRLFVNSGIHTPAIVNNLPNWCLGASDNCL